MSGGTTCPAVCTCVQSLDKVCALCGFGLEVFVPCSSTEGLTLSTEEVSDLRNSLHHDCHTPDEDSDDDMSVAGTKRTFDDLSSNASSGRGRPDGEGASDSDGGGPLLRKKVKNVTPTYRPQAEEHGEPRTRISLEFSAVDTQDMDPRVFSLSKPMPAPRAGLGPVSFDVPV